MYIVIVDIHVKHDHLNHFLEAMLANAKSSLIDEPGCVRFDVIQDEADPTHLILYEIYRDKDAFQEDHLKRPHFLRWREAVSEWHATPPVAWKGANLHPEGDAIA